MTTKNEKPENMDLFSNKEQETVNRGPVECLGMTFENDDKRREYFLQKLREKLDDHEFRKIEGFPIGSDEDILALSDPPYYTACPNPWIGNFIKHYGKPYDPNEPYSREPFAADVSEGKSDPIYNAHTYHTKVPHKAIMRYILHYTEPGDVVFDGFCGTGMTGVAAQACATPETSFKLAIENEFPDTKWGGRKAVLVDLSPAATFIARNYNSQPPIRQFKRMAQTALLDIRKTLGWLYNTSYGGKQADIYHTVWSDVFVCPECAADMVFWQCAVDSVAGSIADELRCPDCGAITHKRQLSRRQETVLNPDTGKAITRCQQIPVIIKGLWGRHRVEKVPDDADVSTIRRSEQEPISNWYPTDRIDGDIDLWYERDYTPLGVYSIDGFFTRRNLRILAALWDYAQSLTDYDVRMALLFALTGMQVNLSRMNRWRHNVSFPYNPLSGTLYIGALPVESNVFIGIDNKVARLGKIWAGCPLRGEFALSTGSSSKLDDIPDNSIDYIFIDPPFGSNIIYSDLSIIWESWLRIKTNTGLEAVVHRRKKKNPSTLNSYVHLMTGCFSEMQRTLKPGRWITVEFHNTKNAVWTAIQEALLRSGFVVADVRVLDKHLGTFKQVIAAGAVKQDLVISAYKPNGGLEERFRLEAGTEDGVWDFIRTHLKQLPVFVSKDGRAEVIAERQNYLLFDRMMAFHVQRGVTVPLSAAEFYAGLAQRFSERDGMYFLPEQSAEYDKKRMTVREILQLEIAITGESTAIEWLRQRLTQKPQTFQELYPQFMKEIAGWQKFEKSLELSELLEQNFLRYEGTGPIPMQIVSWMKQSSKLRELIGSELSIQGLETRDQVLVRAAKDRWYVPDPNKAGDLEKLRERALLKEFWEYLPPGYKPQSHEAERTYLPGLAPKAAIPRGKRFKVIRLEAVRAGFKHCWQNRDYHTIIAVAERIPENVLQEDPKLLMWYDQATTRTGG
jgi:DNA modification methylase